MAGADDAQLVADRRQPVPAVVAVQRLELLATGRRQVERRRLVVVVGVVRRRRVGRAVGQGDPLAAGVVRRRRRARDRRLGRLVECRAASRGLWRHPAGRVRGRLPSPPTGSHRGRLKSNQPSLHETQGGSQAQLWLRPLRRSLRASHTYPRPRVSKLLDTGHRPCVTEEMARPVPRAPSQVGSS
jgi:hypothetical protein